MDRGLRQEARFNGYFTGTGAREDEELTHVGRGTRGGEYLRRFWHPIALTAELTEVPLPIRVLGEDLVLFRDGQQRLGLLHRRCSHRGTSLEYGCIEDEGLRCCYHGWLYDIDGTVLETPAEPDTSQLRSKVEHGAYATRERAGLVFAYLGPPDEQPELPVYDTWVHPPDNELVPFKLRYECNWLQVHENTADPIHIPFLHGRVNGVQFSPGFNELPALSFADTPLGMVVASTRYAGGRVWVRTADVMLPNVAQYPPAYETGEVERLVLGAWATRWIVPIDDTTCSVIGFRHFNDAIDPHGQGRRDEVGLERIDFAGQTAAPEHERQRNPGDYEAMVGQGPITIHDDEHLMASDRGVVKLRRLLRQEIRAVAEGRRAEAAGPSPRATYTYEAGIPWPEPGPADLGAIGDLVLETLVATADEPPAERAAHVAARFRELPCR